MLTLMYNMAPRRGGTGYASSPLQDIHNLPLEAETEGQGGVAQCCLPGECLRGKQPIRLDQIHEAVKVTCNNDNCSAGFMHKECFDHWEQSVLTYLKNCGRARSWSDRQRQQNLWTKKGYDLAYKACACQCERGHLRKDLDWNPVEELGKKKKKKSRSNAKPALSVSALHNNNGDVRGRTGSLSSSNGSSSLPDSGLSVSPIHTLSSTGAKRKIRFDQLGDSRSVAAMNGSGIFTRRQDFSSFNSLPRHKLNSYHIKMEDEGNHGNDETRCFILSTLAAHNSPKVVCLLCQSTLPVYDRYPLVDGTFFLSPRQHSKHCFEAKVEGKTQYLSVVCMDCLEGTAPGRKIKCRYCTAPWDGSSLILGTMYSYDIFAAQACCNERYKCNNCQKSLVSSFQKMPFYSDYSHRVACSQCGVQDFHFIKSLAFCFSRDIP